LDRGHPSEKIAERPGTTALKTSKENKGGRMLKSSEILRGDPPKNHMKGHGTASDGGRKGVGEKAWDVGGEKKNAMDQSL